MISVVYVGFILLLLCT